MATTPADDDRGRRDDDGPTDRSHLSTFLTDTLAPWLRFIGPGRLLGASGVVLVLAGAAWWLLRAPAPSTESRLPLTAGAAAAGPTTSTSSSSSTSSPTTITDIKIHVTGAVREPGVYELSAGQRVADAIVAAGGALAGADPNALNLAAPVSDGDRIAIPTREETSAGGPIAAGHTPAAPPSGTADVPGPVDINSATITELETLPQIGPATAAAIVEFRAEHGPFASVDDLEAVPGIGPATLEAVRELVAT